MKTCLSCGTDIGDTHDLCKKCRNVLEIIFKKYYEDPVVERGWDNFMTLMAQKGYFPIEIERLLGMAEGARLEADNSRVNNYHQVVGFANRKGRKSIVELYLDVKHPRRR